MNRNDHIFQSETSSASITNKVLTIAHDDFDYNTNYTVTISAGTITEYAEPIIWSFTTTMASSNKDLSSTEVTVYPNPAKGIIYIETGNNSTPEVKLYSLQGALLLVEKRNQIDISGFPDGIYILQVGGKQIKIVKE